MNVQQAQEIVQAQEVLITLPAPMPNGLLRCLAERPGPPGQVQVLCHQFHEPNYLLSLLRLGFQVFQARMPEEMLVILDRRLGYHLPQWTRLAAPFDLACRLLWQREGAYTRLRGRIASAEPGQDPSFHLIALAEWQHIRIAWRGARPPEVGETITILGLQHFILGTTLPVLLEAIGLWPGEEPS